MLDTVDRTRHLDAERYLYLAGCSQQEAQDFVEQHSLDNVQIGIQHGLDLGERMWNAYTEVHSSQDRIIFLGADSPSVPLSYIRTAFEILMRVSVVVGPADDGGYILLGLSQPNHEIFSDIAWGSSEVWSQTLAKLSKQTYEVLPKWYDIDREEDLYRLAVDLRKEFEGYPKRTRYVLTKWGISSS